MSRQTWHQYESGRRDNPTLAVLHAMAAALEITPSELLDDVDPPGANDEKKTTPA